MEIMAEEEKKGRVCVTGAGGFIASWVINLLLSNGYTVNGTVREPSNGAKNGHLMKLENASPEKLKLFKADLMDYGALRAAIHGCNGVIHIASPVIRSAVIHPEEEVLGPAVKGTMNVLRASVEAKVRRVVYVSSLAAVRMNPDIRIGQVVDESCWSDEEYCRRNEKWYGLSKTMAEREAFDLAVKSGLDLVSVCPSLTFGPLLQSSVNASSFILLQLMQANGGDEASLDRVMSIVDVRDVAAAILMVYEKREAQGRYLCTAHNIKLNNLITKIKTRYPNYTYPSKFTEIEEAGEIVSTAKLQRLGWCFKPLEETIVDSIENYLQLGILQSNNPMI